MFEVLGVVFAFLFFVGVLRLVYLRIQGKHPARLVVALGIDGFLLGICMLLSGDAGIGLATGIFSLVLIGLGALLIRMGD